MIIDAMDRINAHCDAAVAAFDKRPDLVPLLRALSANLDDRRGEIISVCELETGLDAARIDGEISRTTYQLDAFAELSGSADLLQPIIDTADAGRTPPRADQRRVNTPLGPVGVFAASNFPLAFGILGTDTASALASGCPVVVKAHPAHPETSAILTEVAKVAVRDTGLPGGVLSVVEGGVEVGEELVAHPGIAAIAFTGSRRGGTALLTLAARRPQPIPVYAEMSAANPVFVGRQAARLRSREIAEGWVAAITASAGQLCTKPGLLVLPSQDAADEFSQHLVRLVAEKGRLRMLSPGLSDNFASVRDAQAALEGVTWISRPVREPQGSSLQTPTVLRASADTLLSHPALYDEMFGPGGIVIVSSGEDQSHELVRTMPGSLAAGLFAGPADQAWLAGLTLALEGKVGRIVHDGWPTGVSVGWGTVHGGPWPATSAPQTTSVGLTAAYRFTRPVAFQNVHDDLLPRVLRRDNPDRSLRRLDGRYTESAG